MYMYKCTYERFLVLQSDCFFLTRDSPVAEVKNKCEYKKHFTIPSTCSAVFSSALRMLFKE